jgi:CheY-like chemotaxis protein
VRHIFIAEDNYADAVLLREAMREAGVEADYDVVEDGERAIQRLRALRQRHDHPDLIVLDLNLPRVRGHEILHFIKHDHELSKVRTVVVTSSNAARDRESCRAADGYFLKCSDWDDCLKLARSLVAYLKPNGSGEDHRGSG